MKKQTKLLSLLISLALLLTILPSTVRAEGSQEEPQPVVGECEVFVTNHTVPEDDGYTEAELLEGYFFSVSGLYEDNSSPFLAPRPALPGELSSVYNEVKPMVKLVADGTRASTIFELPGTWTKPKSEWGITGEVISADALTAEASTVIWYGWRVQIPPSWHFFYDGPSVHGQSSLVVETLDTGVNFYLEDPPPNWKWNDLLSDDRAVQGQVVECTKNGQSLYGAYFPPRKNGYFCLHFQLTSIGDAETVSRAGTISGTRLPTEEEKANLGDLLFSVEAEESPGKNLHPGPGGPENEPFRS